MNRIKTVTLGLLVVLGACKPNNQPSSDQLDQAMAKNAELSVQVQTLSADRARINTALETNLRETDELKAKITTLNAQSTSEATLYNGQLSAQKDAKDKAEAELVVLKAQLTTAGVDKVALQKTIDAKTAEVNTKINEIKNLNDKVAKAEDVKKAAVAQVQTKLDAKNVELAGKIKELENSNTQLVKITSELKTVTTDRDAFKTKYEAELKQVTAKETEVKTLCAQVEDLKKQIAATNISAADLKKLQDDKAALDAKIVAVNKDLDAQKKQVTDLEAENSGLKTDNVKLNAQIKNMEAENARLRVTIENLQKQVDTLGSSVANLSEAAKDSMKMITSLNDERRSLTSQLDAQKSAYEAIITDLRSKVNGLETNKKILEDQLAAAKKDADTARDQAEKARAETKKAQAEADRLRDQAAAAAAAAGTTATQAAGQ